MKTRSTAIILLKTQSVDDAYDELIRSLKGYNPIFVPVLQYTRVNEDALREILTSGRIGSGKSHWRLSIDSAGGEGEGRGKGDAYGGLIITSQRAVEALGDALKHVDAKQRSHILDAKVYVVGPATKTAVINLGFKPRHVLGAETGNGAALADYIIKDYSSHNHSYNHHNNNGLLFLVGETRRDVIPKTLSSHTPPISVTELVVYESHQSQDFENELRGVLDTLDEVHRVSDDLGQEPEEETRWIVVFSPAGGKEAMKVIEHRRRLEDHVTYRICTIGPTTWDHLVNECGFQPDVVAKTPSPEGLMEEIQRFKATGGEENR